MARIRSIHPGLTSDESYMSMSMTAKAAWVPLWMHCDDHGIFEWKPIVLKALIFPADNVDFSAVLLELESLDCIKRITVDGKPCGIVRNFAKYQRPKNPSYRFFKDNDFPDYLGSYIAIRGSIPPALPQPYPSPPENPPQMKEEGGRDRMVDARVRGRSAFTDGSKRLAEAFWKSLGFDDPLQIPPEFAGIDWRAIEWERAGWTTDLIEAEAKRLARDRPLKPLNYFEKVFATAFAKRQAPLPVVEVRSAEKLTVNHGKNQHQPGSLIGAIDRELAALEAEESADLALPEGAIRRLSN